MLMLLKPNKIWNEKQNISTAQTCLAYTAVIVSIDHISIFPSTHVKKIWTLKPEKSFMWNKAQGWGKLSKLKSYWTHQEKVLNQDQ